MNDREGLILVADDDPNDVFLVQRAFQKINLRNPMKVVNDGQEAMAYLNGEGDFFDRGRYPLPTLLLLDLKMPRKSGFEVLDWVRRQPGLKRLVIVVLTSSNQNSDVNLAYDLGANSYLVKPAGFDNLLNLVENVQKYWLGLSEKPEVRVA
jgi:CheY-like chemotaxis protein